MNIETTPRSIQGDAIAHRVPSISKAQSEQVIQRLQQIRSEYLNAIETVSFEIAQRSPQAESVRMFFTRRNGIWFPPNIWRGLCLG